MYGGLRTHRDFRQPVSAAILTSGPDSAHALAPPRGALPSVTVLSDAAYTSSEHRNVDSEEREPWEQDQGPPQTRGSHPSIREEVARVAHVSLNIVIVDHTMDMIAYPGYRTVGFNAFEDILDMRHDLTIFSHLQDVAQCEAGVRGALQRQPLSASREAYKVPFGDSSSYRWRGCTSSVRFRSPARRCRYVSHWSRARMRNRSNSSPRPANVLSPHSVLVH